MNLRPELFSSTIKDQFITIHHHSGKIIKLLPDTGDEVLIREALECLGIKSDPADWYIYTNQSGEHWLTPNPPSQYQEQ